MVWCLMVWRGAGFCQVCCQNRGRRRSFLWGGGFEVGGIVSCCFLCSLVMGGLDEKYGSRSLLLGIIKACFGIFFSRNYELCRFYQKWKLSGLWLFSPNNFNETMKWRAKHFWQGGNVIMQDPQWYTPQKPNGSFQAIKVCILTNCQAMPCSQPSLT